jgi:uncharacterized protein (UPF0335 family)
MTKHTENITSQGVAAKQLQAIVDRIEKIEAEISERNDLKKDIYAEAKANGYCVPALKTIIGERRKMEKNKGAFTETAEMAELYRHALGMGGPQIDMFAGEE